MPYAAELPFATLSSFLSFLRGKPEVARAAKEVTNGRGKRSRKRAALEADEPEPEIEPEIEPEPEQEVARMIEGPELCRASVAR
jgi:hypothetical protein